MNVHRINKISGIRSYLVVPFVLFMLAISSADAQGFNQKYNVYLIGQVTNNDNGAPLK